MTWAVLILLYDLGRVPTLSGPFVEGVGLTPIRVPQPHLPRSAIPALLSEFSFVSLFSLNELFLK